MNKACRLSAIAFDFRILKVHLHTKEYRYYLPLQK